MGRHSEKGRRSRDLGYNCQGTLVQLGTVQTQAVTHSCCPDTALGNQKPCCAVSCVRAPYYYMGYFFHSLSVFLASWVLNWALALFSLLSRERPGFEQRRSCPHLNHAPPNPLGALVSGRSLILRKFILTGHCNQDAKWPSNWAQATPSSHPI